MAWILAIVLFFLSRTTTTEGVVLLCLSASAVVAIAALYWTLKAWFQRWTTETDVTNLRVVHKTGFIKRRTFEMSLDTVESVDVNQSILGRILKLRRRNHPRRRRGQGNHFHHRFPPRLPQLHHCAIGATRNPWPCSKILLKVCPVPPASTVDPSEVAKFSKLSDEWWDPKGKMAPLHKINPLRLAYIRDAAAASSRRNVKSLNCLSGLRILDIGCGAGLLCEPFTRLGAQVIGVDPSASNIAAARLHADKGHLSIDYRCTTVERMDVRERFDIVLAMEVVEHVHRRRPVHQALRRDAQTRRHDGDLDAEPQLEELCAGHRRRGYVLRWLPRGTHQWDKFVTPPTNSRIILPTTSSPSPSRPAWSTTRSPTAGISPPTWT